MLACQCGERPRRSSGIQLLQSEERGGGRGWYLTGDIWVSVSMLVKGDNQHGLVLQSGQVSVLGLVS